MKCIRNIMVLIFLLSLLLSVTSNAAECIIEINGLRSQVNEATRVSAGLSIGKNTVRAKYGEALKAQKDSIKTVFALFCDGILSEVKIVPSTPVAKNAHIPYAMVEFNVEETAQEYYIKPFFFESFENLQALNNKGKETVTSGVLAENKIVVDGKTLDVNENTQAFNNPSWIYMEENNGYVFLQDADVNVKRQLSEKGTTFAVITQEHGENPENQQYAYAIIPHASEEETEEFAQNPSVKLLEVSENVHALYDEESGKYYINVFKGSYFFEEANVTLSACSAIINKKDTAIYEFWIADPTHKAGQITAEFASDIESIGGEDKAFITYDGKRLSVNTEKRPGSTFAFTVKISH